MQKVLPEVCGGEVWQVTARLQPTRDSHFPVKNYKGSAMMRGEEALINIKHAASIEMSRAG